MELRALTPTVFPDSVTSSKKEKGEGQAYKKSEYSFGDSSSKARDHKVSSIKTEVLKGQVEFEEEPRTIVKFGLRACT